MRAVGFVPDFAGWRAAARPLLAARVPPGEILWQPEGPEGRQAALPGLLDPGPAPSPSPPAAAPGGPPLSIPAAFVRLGEDAACYRDHRPDGGARASSGEVAGSRWALLYRVAFRLTGGEVGLLEDAADPDVHRLQHLARSVKRDAHKMQAFVRFRRVEHADGDWYIAWHRPDHHVLPNVAPFFVERFNGMRWSILTPDASAHWDGQQLRFAAGVPAHAAPSDDALDDLWRTYYAAIFNPARLNLTATRRELPVRHWPTLPEARLIAPLAAEAQARTRAMADPALTRSARSFLPPDPGASLAELAAAARTCQGCPLFGPATQTVFGEGPADARIVLVGEQPGNDEDLAGHPFVGPAGGVLDEALREAGLDRRALYLTNAVKHFKFEPRGKWRLHQRPRGREVQACKPWVLAELDRIRPTVLVALGATAASALFGPAVSPTRHRTRPLPSPLAPICFVTYHPSAALRADPAHARDLRAALTADLRQAREAAEAPVQRAR